MLQGVHGRKISIKVVAPAGDTIVVASVPGTWLYIHDLIGDMSITGTLEVLAGSRSLAKFSLDAGQGLTLSDEPGEDNRPRFECVPGEDFILRTTTGTFEGSCHYSFGH